MGNPVFSCNSLLRLTLERQVKQHPIWTAKAENNWTRNKDCSLASAFVMVVKMAQAACWAIEEQIHA